MIQYKMVLRCYCCFKVIFGYFNQQLPHTNFNVHEHYFLFCFIFYVIKRLVRN